MSEFAFDFTAMGCVRVQADTLEQAVAFLRTELSAYDFGSTGHHMPTGGTNVEQAVLTEISIGPTTTPAGSPLATLALFEVDGEMVNNGDSIEMGS